MNTSGPEGSLTSLEQARAVLRRHEDLLLSKANVLGVGIGQQGDSCVLVALVKVKIPADQLEGGDLIPDSLEGVQVRVQEIGDLQAQ